MNFVTSIGLLMNQPIINTDTYKTTHWTFEHPEFERQYGYLEARKGGAFKEVQWFGFQYILSYFLSQRITHEMIDEAVAELAAHGVECHESMWRRVVDYFGGIPPLTIKALPEGIIVPQGTVLATVESTDPECAGLAVYFETLLMRVWYPTTIATRSMRWWRLIHEYLTVSGNPDTTDFKMVDFGARGAASTEAAAIGGMAHLLNFQVTDNLMGIRFAKHAYPMDAMPGFSIPATEHSVTTSWGAENEKAFFQHILKVHGRWGEDGPRNPVSVVIDTYDQDNAIRMWLTPEAEGGLLGELQRSNMQLVLRPDSGDPIINVVHILDLVGSLVGSTTNEKGYRVLPDFVRIIQGDGINEETLRRILQRVVYHKWSIDNLTFGSGGGLLVHAAERDTHRFAMKASEVIIGGEVREIQKTVKTDPTKASKKGRFAVVIREGKVVTISQDELGEDEDDLLDVVWDHGLMWPTGFTEVREMGARFRSLPAAA
ncbi:putative nicotinate phosphoribosyltransferase [Sphingobium phage Lacusarx]|uniref:Nicotinamide phosphoribosyltransferase n=1 Tax=Sphingobium phage Lacusarx TaxID=1980139 RepID=A0A1W6DWX3_9CAUD|nr:nicotinamide phosphoribosyl transferase [Sphingobium phage Lacusarx]ARK07510.1 putative nicotinate phosphoribosyltransferase [Sphingobium phage Lacusarx]